MREQFAICWKYFQIIRPRRSHMHEIHYHIHLDSHWQHMPSPALP